LKDGIPSDYPHYQFVGMIEREIERVVKIVRQMYELYRTEPSRQDGLALSALLQDLAYLVDPQLIPFRMAIKTEIAVASPDSYVVPRDVLQVLLNLIQNAIDVSPEGDTIRLNIAQDDRQLRILVADDGPGIEPEVLPHIFEPFYSRKKGRGQSGMGLGLSVCHSLVQAMGGRIEVDTEAR
jgi:signal transduction histidine kinase